MNTFLIIIAVIFVIAAVLLCLYVGVFGVLMYLLDEMMDAFMFWWDDDWGGSSRVPAYTCVRRVFLFFILVTFVIFTEQTNKYEQARSKTKISQYESRSS